MNTTVNIQAVNSGTRLSGKVAFVHGGSRGIGAATARRLARDGASVAIGYGASAIAAEALVEEIKASGGNAIALKADATDAAGLTRAIDGRRPFRPLGHPRQQCGRAGHGPAGPVHA